MRVFTIGHSTHPIEAFIALLDRHSIDCIADVRSAPYSRRNPQFNRENLQRSLKMHGIAYVWLGRELGARAEDDACYVDGKVQFDRLAATTGFRSGIDRMVEGSQKYTVAMMCAEKEPLDCHRTILVARRLAERGVAIEHILENGETERHEDTIGRLVDLVGLDRSDLFRSEEDIVADAYRLREREVAYEDEGRRSPD